MFCFLISEARETTALEMPDRENTFVLKADNNMEYVIEAHDIDDMRSWLATIRYCMRSPPTQQPPLDMSVDPIMAATMSNPTTNDNLANSATGPTSVSGVPASTTETGGGGGANSLAPKIPPRRTGEQRLSASSNFELTEGDLEQSELNMADLAAEMRQYPWFYGTLPRSEAARVVLHTEAAGHGIFLVRQSETRKGEYVLTFNFHGRAKDLRMTLNDCRQCRVQHLWFPSITEMLEHFKQNPIPLESGGTSDVTLANYVFNQDAALMSDEALGNNSQQHPSPRHVR